jgi:hypothetical protein
MLPGFQKMWQRPQVRNQLIELGYTSPESVMLRQFAGSRVAPFIAGPGQIQQDDRPVLEFRAPQAFYLNANAKELFRFDDRARQLHLAPQEKKRAIGSLTDETILTAFMGANSCNQELNLFLNWWGQATGGLELFPKYNAPDPVLFRPASTYRDVAENAENLSTLQLVYFRHPAKAAETIAKMETILSTPSRAAANGDYEVEGRIFLAKYWLGQSELTKADPHLQALTKLAPDHVEVQFLERVRNSSR